MTRGVHHLYVETRDWKGSIAFWDALGFRLDEGWGARHDGILSPLDGRGPYVFLREVPDDHDHPLAFQVVFGAEDLDQVASAEGVLVDRAPYASGWGADLLDVRDPDGRVLTIREEAVAGPDR